MSMVCQRCQEAKATVHITDTLPEKREQHFCEDCAEKEGIISKQPHTTNEILQQFIKQKTGMEQGEGVACPKCGMTFREFQLKGQLGCPNDYAAFEELLMPLIERAHEGGTQHLGKVPLTADGVTKKIAGLVRLRRELQDAIDAENYEVAADVRDKIQNLEDS